MLMIADWQRRGRWWASISTSSYCRRVGDCHALRSHDGVDEVAVCDRRDDECRGTNLLLFWERMSICISPRNPVKYPITLCFQENCSVRNSPERKAQEIDCQRRQS